MNRTTLFKRWVFTGMIAFLLPMISFSNQPEDMFPKFSGWDVEVGDKVYTPDNLWDIINGAADAYLSYDFQRLYTAEYINNQDKSLKVYIFEHSTPTNAFGIYSQERSRDYDIVETGAQGFKSGDAYYFITGPYYIQISSNDKGLQNSMQKLAEQLDKKLGKPDRLPEELAFFPGKSKVPYSEKYIAGNFLGYSYLHSAFIADYKINGESFQVFLISPEDKEETDQILSKYLDFVEYPNDERNKNKFEIEDPYNGSIMLYRKGKYLCGVMGTDNKDTKEQYLTMLRDQLE